MKKYKKVLLITSACLLFGGGIMAVTGLAMGGRPGFIITDDGIKTAEDFKGEFVEKTVPLKNIENLNINFMDGDVEILEGDDFHVEYGYDDKRIQIKEELKEGTYTLNESYIRHTSSFSFYSFGSGGYAYQDSYLKIYIPKDTKLKNVNIANSYGKMEVEVENTSMDKVRFQMESGNMKLKGMDCKEMEIDMSYGNLNVEDSIIGKLKAENESGKGNFSDLKSDSIELKFDYGDLNMSQITSEILSVKNESGAINITDAKGKTFDVKDDYGSVKLSAVTMNGITVDNENGEIALQEITADTLNIATESGGVSGSQVKADKSDMKLSYGNLHLTGFTTKDTKVFSESGEISLDMTEPEAKYDLALVTEYGEVSINGDDHGTDMTREKGAPNKLDLNTESGNIRIKTK